MDRYVAAAVQLAAGADKPANLERAVTLIQRAADAGAQLVVLPEVCLWRGLQADEPQQAETIPGPSSQRFAAVAAERRIHLLAGSLLESSDDGRAYNTSLLFGPDGSTLGCYRKIHLFDVDLPGRVSIRESDTRRPGEVPVVAPTELGGMGLSVCYDVRFPELYRHLARAGAEVLCVPAAFTFVTGAAHWEVLLRARAIENQCYVIAANQFGTGGGVPCYGNSMIIDPWGTVLARGGEGERIIFAEIDRAYLRQVRSELPSLRHARL